MVSDFEEIVSALSGEALCEAWEPYEQKNSVFFGLNFTKFKICYLFRSNGSIHFSLRQAQEKNTHHERDI